MFTMRLRESGNTDVHIFSVGVVNHIFGNPDHRSDQQNLMYNATNPTKRDLDADQCLEMRANYEEE